MVRVETRVSAASIMTVLEIDLLATRAKGKGGQLDMTMSMDSLLQLFVARHRRFRSHDSVIKRGYGIKAGAKTPFGHPLMQAHSEDARCTLLLVPHSAMGGKRPPMAVILAASHHSLRARG